MVAPLLCILPTVASRFTRKEVNFYKILKEGEGPDRGPGNFSFLSKDDFFDANTINKYAMLRITAWFAMPSSSGDYFSL